MPICLTMWLQSPGQPTACGRAAGGSPRPVSGQVAGVQLQPALARPRPLQQRIAKGARLWRLPQPRTLLQRVKQLLAHGDDAVGHALQLHLRSRAEGRRGSAAGSTALLASAGRGQARNPCMGLHIRLSPPLHTQGPPQTRATPHSAAQRGRRSTQTASPHLPLGKQLGVRQDNGNDGGTKLGRVGVCSTAEQRCCCSEGRRPL